MTARKIGFVGSEADKRTMGECVNEDKILLRLKQHTGTEP